MKTFNEHPGHGTSIGVRGERGGGTLGGYFVMRSPATNHIGFDPVSQKTQEQFCSQGDSGSLIIDREGSVAGILWGEMRGWCGPEHRIYPYIGAGLVTDINDVMAGMKMALGWPEGATVDVLQCL